MSDAVPGLVETSTNLGIVTVQDGQMEIIMFPRSSVDSGLEDVAQMIASVWDLAGYPAELSDYFAAWTPDADSPISNLMKTTHFDLFGQEPAIAAVHAGLECGEIGATYPEMDMISIGPTIEHGHSPAEDLYIPSVEKAMALLMEVLQRMPEESSQTVAGPVVSHN
jgi:dipeptidase D